MKVESLSSLRSTAPRRSTPGKAKGSSSFADVLAQEAPAASAVNGTAAVGAMDSLLALQEVPESLAQRRDAERRGESLLDQLEELRLGLLSGALSRASLERLAAVLKGRAAPTEDPRLAEILAEIELRAAVELAKYEVAGRRRQG